jgi:hypothetical protein
LALPTLSNPISLPYGPVDRIEFRRFRNRGALKLAVATNPPAGAPFGLIDEQISIESPRRRFPEASPSRKTLEERSAEAQRRSEIALTRTGPNGCDRRRSDRRIRDRETKLAIDAIAAGEALQ